jgi:bacteriocin-like protein
MEKIMSKTNDTSRELTTNELDAVSGGADQYKESIAIDSWSWSGGGGGGVSDSTMIAYGRANAGVIK